MSYLIPTIQENADLSEVSSIETELSELAISHNIDVKNFLNHLKDSEILKKAYQVFTETSTALLPAGSRSLLFLLMRYLKPSHVLEIGTYKAGTTEILARAAKMNQKGMIFTTDPFGKERVPNILQTWPESLKKHVTFLPLSSMDCYFELDKQALLFELIFVDGDHGYAHALFDLQMAAKHMTAGGIVVMDNFEQTGVYWAVKNFLSNHPDWKEVGNSLTQHNQSDPFVSMNPSFPDSSFLILQAPKTISLTEFPRSFTTPSMPEKGLAGFEFRFSGGQCEGTLHVMLFCRSFWHGGFVGIPEQICHKLSIVIREAEKIKHLELREPYLTALDPKNSFRMHELILSWQPRGNQPLELLEFPTALKIV